MTSYEEHLECVRKEFAARVERMRGSDTFDNSRFLTNKIIRWQLAEAIRSVTDSDAIDDAAIADLVKERPGLVDRELRESGTLRIAISWFAGKYISKELEEDLDNDRIPIDMVIRNHPEVLGYEDQYTDSDVRTCILGHLHEDMARDLADEARSELLKGQDEGTLPGMLNQAAAELRASGDVKAAEKAEALIAEEHYDARSITEIINRPGMSRRTRIELDSAAEAFPHILSMEPSAPTP